MNLIVKVLICLLLMHLSSYAQEKTPELTTEYNQAVNFLGSGIGYSNSEKSIIQFGINYEKYFSNWSLSLGIFTKMVQAGEGFGVQAYLKYFFDSADTDGFYFLAGGGRGKENYDDKKNLSGQTLGIIYQWVFGSDNQKYWGLGYGRIFLPGRTDSGALLWDFGIKF